MKNPSHHRPRRGISLLEILISMFVLLIGLMGVASLFPVGGFYMAKGERFDRSSVMAEQAVDDLRTRGILRPERWLHVNNNPGVFEHIPPEYSVPPLIHPLDEPPEGGTFNIDASSYASGVLAAGRAFIIDPLGAAAALESTPPNVGAHVFPYWDLGSATSGGAPHAAMAPEWGWVNAAGVDLYDSSDPWPIRRVTLRVINPTSTPIFLPMPTVAAETAFRLRDELAVELPEDGDQPARQLFEFNNNGGLLTRSWQGNYSWLATVVPSSTDGVIALQPADDGYGSFFYEVSVAVIYKRDPVTGFDIGAENPERSIRAELNIGGELVMFGPDRQTVDAALENVRAGDWIAVAGINQTNGDFLLKWYRLLSLDDETELTPVVSLNSNASAQRAMLDGPDWPPPVGGATTVTNLRAIIIPGVTTVATQALSMERESLWSLE